MSSFGTKSWLFRYMIDGVPRKMGVGALHTVSLAEARKRAAEARLQVHDRLDPIDQRKAARGAARLAAADDALEDFLARTPAALAGLGASLAYAVEIDSGCLPDNGGRIAATLLRSPLFAGMSAEGIAAD